MLFAAALRRFGWILELLAHRDAVAERDQPVKIFIGALDRHAAHRDVLAAMLAALGEHDAERAARDLRVAEEQLVEVAHPVEQQAVGIGGLDLDVLLHQRRDAMVLARGGGRWRHGGGGRRIHGATLVRGVHGFNRNPGMPTAVTEGRGKRPPDDRIRWNKLACDTISVAAVAAMLDIAAATV